MTIDQWHTKVAKMSIDQLKAHIEAFDTQLANMDTRGQQWPTSFEYHCVLQQKRDCIEALAALEAADADVQLSLPF